MWRVKSKSTYRRLNIKNSSEIDILKAFVLFEPTNIVEAATVEDKESDTIQVWNWFWYL